MVKVLPPWKPDTPVAGPGMRISVAPSPHAIWLDDYEYYDQLGRDPLQQNKIWGISDPVERVEKLKELLEEYPKQRHRHKILFKAACRGDDAIVRCLVDTGVKVHPDIPEAQEEEKDDDNDDGAEDGSLPDKDDPTAPPVHVAAIGGKLECVKIFIESGVEVDVRDEFGRTPLIAAADGGDLETIRYLLGQGADPTARANGESDLTKEYMGEFAGADPLEIVAKHGNVEALRLLLEHPFYGSTRKRKNREDEEAGVFVTPLAIKAAAGGGLEALKLLLERGAYPLEEDKDGKTKAELLNEEEKQAIIDATPAAAYLGDLESLKLLLSYQYPTDKDGNILPFEIPETLHKSFIYGAYDSMMKNRPEKFEFIYGFGLTEHETMSLDKLPEGQTLNIQHLFDKAAEAGSIDCVRLLIDKYGADPNKHRMPPGTHPLYFAAANNKTDMVRYLLENHKVDIHLGSGRFAAGPTALWIAINLKSLDSVALLLQHGGPVNHIDEEIRNVSGPVSAILKAVPGTRLSVRFETESNAQKYIDKTRNDYQNMNPAYVRVEVGPDDKSWISKLQLRRPDEELREKGEGARELNRKEGAKLKDLDETDDRRKVPPYPTLEGREKELNEDDDLIPEWQPALVPVKRDDSD